MCSWILLLHGSWWFEGYGEHGSLKSKQYIVFVSFPSYSLYMSLMLVWDVSRWRRPSGSGDGVIWKATTAAGLHCSGWKRKNTASVHIKIFSLGNNATKQAAVQEDVRRSGQGSGQKVRASNSRRELAPRKQHENLHQVASQPCGCFYCTPLHSYRVGLTAPAQTRTVLRPGAEPCPGSPNANLPSCYAAHLAALNLPLLTLTWVGYMTIIASILNWSIREQGLSLL